MLIREPLITAVRWRRNVIPPVFARRCWTTAAGRVYAGEMLRRRNATRSLIFWAAPTKRKTGPRGARRAYARLGEIKAADTRRPPRTRRLVEEVSLSAPILLNDRVLASMTVRFAASAVPLKSGGRTLSARSWPPMRG